MDIKDFTYRNTPVKKTRVYEVHTLSQDGLNQYLDKNSYVHKFLKSLSPNRNTSINFCHNEIYSPELKPKTILQKNESDKFIKESKDFNSKRGDKGAVITINVNNFHKNIYYKPVTDSINFEKAEKIKNENYEDNYGINYKFSNSKNQQNESYVDCENANSEQESKEAEVSDNKKSPEDMKVLENVYNNLETKKKKNTFLQTSKQMFFNQNRLSQNSKNINSLKQKGFMNQKYSEDYNFAISTLREDFLKNIMSYNNTSKNSFSRNKYNGNFKSYEVPHLEYKRQSSNFRINLIRDKLENTILKTGKNTNVNPNNNEDLETINKKIEVENLKLKNYFENINKFTKSDNVKMYPSVSEITNSVNLRTTKLRLLNNKFMGERYDPTNYA